MCAGSQNTFPVGGYDRRLREQRASQSLSAKFPTINTLALGFCITPDRDCQEGIHSPRHTAGPGLQVT